MTPEEYRERIIQSEDQINEQLERDKSALLCSLQAKNRTFVRVPALVSYTGEYERLVTEAKARMAIEAEAIESLFYGSLEELQ